MAKEQGSIPTLAKESDEVGGVVTTVKKENTDDLDVKEALDEIAANEPPVEKKDPEPEPTGKIDVDDEDDDQVDFKALSPKQQKAVAKLYKERRLESKKLRQLERKIEELQSQKADNGGQAPAIQKPALERPTRVILDADRFNSPQEHAAAQLKEDEKYEDQLFDYRKQLENLEKEEREYADQREKLVAKFNQQAVEFAKAHEDYEEVMDADLPLSAIMFGAVLKKGPALGYYFATHEDEAKKIYDMSPDDAYEAIIRITVKLEDEAKGKKKEEPPPPNPKRKQQEPPEPLSGKGNLNLPNERPKTFKEREAEYAKRNPGDLNYA